MDLPSTASGMPSETSNPASAAKHVHASDEASLDMLSTSSATAAVTRKPETDTARLRSSACIVRWRMVALRGATVVGGKCPYLRQADRECHRRQLRERQSFLLCLDEERR